MNTIVNGFFVSVSRACGKYSAAHLVTLLQKRHQSCCPANPAFTGIKPTIAEGQTALDDLKAKDMAASGAPGPDRTHGRYFNETSGLLPVSFRGNRNNRSYALQYAESAIGPWHPQGAAAAILPR